MMTEIIDEVECKNLWTFVTNEILYDKNLETFIPKTVKSEKPEWIVAVDDSATAAIKLKRQKKILINPKVSFDDLIMCRNLQGNIPTDSLTKTMKKIIIDFNQFILIQHGISIY